jgi:hypothetical protein
MEGVFQGSTTAALAHRSTARWLGYAGLLPFLPAFALPWIQDPAVQVGLQKSVMAYAAVILSFIGALHWGVALHSPVAATTRSKLVFSVLPALLAWIALLIPAVWGFALLITGFAVALLVDRHWWSDQPWFFRLRCHLTIGAIASLLFGQLVASGLLF